MDAQPDPPPPRFTPVPVRLRADGWTPELQQAFIAALWETRCVVEACRRVGKSPEAAYKLARRPDAESFRGAWNGVFALPKRPRPPGRPPAPIHASIASSSSTSSTSAPSTSGHQWDMSGSSASSTSGPSTSGPSTSRRGGPAASDPASRRRSAYSLEAFKRVAGASIAARRLDRARPASDDPDMENGMTGRRTRP
ncbi:MAG TPA: hypothetical protein VD887_01110 [Allosphingosinicella sp.]|nr:hypothetical protein [Allosphingosinicella sp.]